MLISPGFPLLGSLTGGLYIYREGIIYGAVQGMRTASMISLGLLVCWTSDPRDLLKGLTAWHLSPQASFMLVTAIRFFPILAAEAGEVMTALQLRSGSEKGRHQVLRHIPYMIKPLLARCLRRAQTLSLSVTSRGLFLAKERKGPPWKGREKGVSLLFLLFVLFCGTSKVLYILSQRGFTSVLCASFMTGRNGIYETVENDRPVLSSLCYLAHSVLGDWKPHALADVYAPQS